MAIFLGRAAFVEPMQRLTAHGGKISTSPKLSHNPAS
jgi:hypothetical protein